MTSLTLHPSLVLLLPPACALSFYLFCGQSRICELIISGSIAGFSSAPSRQDQWGKVIGTSVALTVLKEREEGPGDP